MRRAFLLLGAIFLLAACAGAGPNAAVTASAGVPTGKWVLIETDLKRLTVYQGREAVCRYPIATGAWDTPTPLGVFYVNGRFRTEMSGFGTRFLSLSVPWGKYGIHGTNKPESIGRNASHGCVRLRVKDAEALYALLPFGVRVVMDGGPYGALTGGYRTLRDGDRGADVYQLQQRLIQRGFLHGWPDGVFGPNTQRAVNAAQRALSLPVGDAGPAFQRAMGMILFE